MVALDWTIIWPADLFDLTKIARLSKSQKLDKLPNGQTFQLIDWVNFRLWADLKKIDGVTTTKKSVLNRGASLN